MGCVDPAPGCTNLGHDAGPPRGETQCISTTTSAGSHLVPSAAATLEDLMPDLDASSHADLDYGFLLETNWLEGPIGSDLSFSPLSGNLPAYFDFQSPLEASSSFDQPAAEAAPLPDGSRVTETTETVESPLPSENDLRTDESINGEFYVDGEPARLPRVRRRIYAVAKRVDVRSPHSSTERFSLHVSREEAPAPTNVRFPISEATYRRISELYHHLCRFDGLLGAAFTAHELPSRNTLERFATLYCERFNNILPFLHHTILANEDRHFLLDLAVVAIGSQFEGDAHLSASFHEFSRRCLVFAGLEAAGDFWIAAAWLLHVVGCAYSGHDRLRQHALQARSQLSMRSDDLQGSNQMAPPLDVAEQWRLWIQRESRIRLGFSTWLVDAMLATHCETASTIQLDSLTFSLPCADAVWQARDAVTWSERNKGHGSVATLPETLQRLYYNKCFSIGHTEFVRVLTIHGLYHRLWKVARYHSDTLSQWEPSSTRQSGAVPYSNEPPWLPAVPAFKAWQNSSCDALDILHWQANSTIGQMRGLEPPTVLHLHFARIVLLCPCADILAMARYLSSMNSSATDKERGSRAMGLVRRWAVHHQYKARLSAVHSGVLFWHIRRHGIDAFYEAPCLALACLVLWAFSIYAERDLIPLRPASAAPRESIDPAMLAAAPRDHVHHVLDGVERSKAVHEEADIILLDRPTDDELVQQFIRDGARMRPYISGVGEVFALSAPPRILDKGIELLQHHQCWGVAKEWLTLLRMLRAGRRSESRSN